ncbi:MAG: hypothetical protein AAGB46_04650 [Verrucomicrobiota bacterium]
MAWSRFSTLFIVAIAYLGVPFPAVAGTISGKIVVTPPSGADGKNEKGEYESRRYKFLEKVEYSKFGDFIISVEDIEKPYLGEGPRPQAIISQKNGSFSPRILAVVAGTEVSWPNRDSIYHNVFSISEVEPFDLGYYKGDDEAKRIVFEKPGRIDVFCSIHAEMNCVVMVLPNPWFAKADKNGRFKIEGLPAGEYRLKAWHERLPPKYIEVAVEEEKETELSIEMGFKRIPKP